MTVALQVAPKMAWSFVASRSQTATGMFPRRHLASGHFGATNVQVFRRHYTRSVDHMLGGGCGTILTVTFCIAYFVC